MAAYAQQPRRRVLRPSVVVDATHAHTHTVIMLHGMAFDSSMFEELPAMLGARASTVRWVFPNAPVRTIDWPRGPAPAADGSLMAVGAAQRRPASTPNWASLGDRATAASALRPAELRGQR